MNMKIGTNSKFWPSIARFSMVAALVAIAPIPFATTPAQAASSVGVMKVGLVISPGASIVKASHFSSSVHFTWGAAEVSVAKAGFMVRQRLEAADEVFWFNAIKSNHTVKVGVSSSSGEIVSVSEI